MQQTKNINIEQKQKLIKDLVWIQREIVVSICELATYKNASALKTKDDLEMHLNGRITYYVGSCIEQFDYIVAKHYLETLFKVFTAHRIRYKHLNWLCKHLDAWEAFIKNDLEDKGLREYENLGAAGLHNKVLESFMKKTLDTGVVDQELFEWIMMDIVDLMRERNN